MFFNSSLSSFSRYQFTEDFVRSTLFEHFHFAYCKVAFKSILFLTFPTSTLPLHPTSLINLNSTCPIPFIIFIFVTSFHFIGRSGGANDSPKKNHCIANTTLSTLVHFNRKANSSYNIRITLLSFVLRISCLFQSKCLYFLL